MVKMTWYDRSLLLHCQDLFIFEYSCFFVFVFSFVIAAERTETHLINAQGEMMGFGCISLRQLPHGRRCENVQLDFKERQHGFSARFGGMQTHVLLKQY